MADAIALVDDLFFQSKLRQTAQQMGVALEIASNGQRLLDFAEANPRALVIVDLNARQGVFEALGSLHSSGAGGDANGAENGQTAGNPRRVIAFLSHVQTDLAERARAEGCQEVMPRSKFTQNLPEILRSAKS